MNETQCVPFLHLLLLAIKCLGFSISRIKLGFWDSTVIFFFFCLCSLVELKLRYYVGIVFPLMFILLTIFFLNLHSGFAKLNKEDYFFF